MISFKLISSAVYGFCAALALAATHEPPPLVTVTIIPHLVRSAEGSAALIVRFAIEPKWHLYWTNPGDSGTTETVKLTMPAGWCAQPAVFPRPQVFGTSGDRTYGYESSLDLIVPVQAPPGEMPAAISVRASITWMACKGLCVTGKNELTLDIATAVRVPAPPQVVRAYPTKLPGACSARIESTAPLALLITAPATMLGGRAGRFIPDSIAGIEFLAGTGPFLFTPAGELLTMRVPLEVHPKDVVDGPTRIRGLLLMGECESDPAYQIDLAPPDVPVKAK
ncbi:MAG: hypothetical protein EXS17_02935 [Phycisphaerales bacterium]|nr:hypothetical protein [Phycisphaerales bacterium]